MDVLFCQTEVDHVDDVRLLANAHQEIVRLDIPVQDVLVVNDLDSLH